MCVAFIGGFGEEAPGHDKLEVATFQLFRPCVLQTPKQGRHLVRQFIQGFASNKDGSPPIICHVQSRVFRSDSLRRFAATYELAMPRVWQPKVLVVCDCNLKKVANVCFKLIMVVFCPAQKIRQQQLKRNSTRGRIIRTFLLVQAEMINQAWRNKESELTGARSVTMGPAFDAEQRPVVRIQSERRLHRTQFSRLIHKAFNEWCLVERNHLAGRTALLFSGPNKKHRDGNHNDPSNTLEPEAWFAHQKPGNCCLWFTIETPFGHPWWSLRDHNLGSMRNGGDAFSRLIEWTFVWWTSGCHSQKLQTVQAKAPTRATQNGVG